MDDDPAVDIAALVGIGLLVIACVVILITGVR